MIDEVDVLAGELWLARTDLRHEAALARIVPVLVRVARELDARAPLGAIADAAVDLAPWLALRPGGVSRMDRPSPVDRELARALRRVDDELGRLAMEPAAAVVRDSLGGRPVAERDRALVVVLSELWAPLGDGDPPSEHALRALSRLPHDAMAERARRALSDRAVSEALAERLEALCRRARDARTWADDGVVLVASAALALEARSARLALAQLARVGARLDGMLPRWLASRARTRGTHPTALDAASVHPTGGFAEIGTSGAMENLVTSELAAMDEGPPPDLFTVRWASGELLYYLRDESVALRRPFVVTFVLSRDLEGARVKDPELPAQRIVLALALVTVAARRIALELRHENLAFRVALPMDGLALEAPLLELTLDGLGLEIEIARLAPSELDAALTADLRRGDALELVIGTEPRADARRPAHLRSLHVGIDAAPRVAEEETGPGMHGWAAALERIVRIAVA